MAILLNTIIEEGDSQDSQPILLKMDRSILYKRRWRAECKGMDIAVDLDAPVAHGTVLADTNKQKMYRIEQLPEEVVVIPIPEEATMAAKIGWYLGNRHIPIEVREDTLVMENFPTLVDSLLRIGIKHEVTQDILRCAPHSADHRH